MTKPPLSRGFVVWCQRTPVSPAEGRMVGRVRWVMPPMVRVTSAEAQRLVMTIR
ncbi:hypothetical protein SAMN04515669_2418 [Jiangella sp. DSM 45060]|nr:hypothetical protein SAMN04515669_2418 [Jiangella sp. DSM 45060]